MAVPYYGDFPEDAMVYIPFNTFTSDNPSASCIITNLIDTDIHYHKNGSIDQYSADAATLVTVNFDGITGNHMCAVDTSENAFFATGSEISVRMEGTTIDGATINAWIGSFSIERAGGVLATLSGTPASVDAILTDTTEIGAAGAGLTNINLPNQTMNIIGDITGNLSGSVGSLTGHTNQTADHKASVEAILVDTGTTLDTLIKDIPTTAEFELRTLLAADYTIVADLGTVQTGDNYAYISGAPASIDAILIDTGTTLDTLVKDIPTTAEFEARSLLSADYTVVGDTIAGVTLVTTCTTNTDMAQAPASIDAILTDTGELQTDWANGGRLDLLIDELTTQGDTNEGKIDTVDTVVDSILDDTDGTDGVAIAAGSLDAIWDRTEAITGDGHTFESMFVRVYRYWMNKLNITDATGAAALRNEADGADIATQGITDAAGTTTRTKVTWA